MNKKKIIILLLILLTLILVLLLIVTMYGNYEKKYEYDKPSDNIPVEIVSTIEEVKVRNNYYAARSCVEKFYQYCTKINTDNYKIVDEETIGAEETIRKQAVYEMLDERYIKYKNITEQNIFEQIPTIEESTINIEEMYMSQKNVDISAYIVYGELKNNKTGEKRNFNILVEMDMLNRTFNIILQDYIDKNIGEILQGKNLNFELPDIIEKNTYNIFDYKNISDEDYITDIFNEFKDYMMNDYECAYKRLDEEYSKKRFTSYEEFENYANNSDRKSLEMQLDKYQITNKNEYTQYTCIDQNNKYYIFYVTGIMDYTVILDTYTIDLPEFTEKYNNASDAEKVLMNIQRVFDAINDKDYRYVYNKLDATFRQNNFPTEADFENYIKQNFYENNTIAYSNYKTSGDLHIYEISIKDKNNENNKAKTKNFIMQLKEGTDFVMSFNVQ